MEAFSFAVLIFLSLMAYSGGAVARAGKNVNLKPQAMDLLLVVIILAGAIFSRAAFDLNKWLQVLIWVTISSVTGLLAISFRKFSKDALITQPGEGTAVTNIFKKLWAGWSNFSRRMGGFQSRILFSLMFFLIVSPFAIAVKVFSDPLKIKPRLRESYWESKKEVPLDVKQYQMQF